MKHRLSTALRLALGMQGLAVLLLVSAPVYAATSKTSTTSKESVNQSVTESYSADQALQRGMLVRLKDGDSNTVVPVSQDKVGKMLGVIVDANKSAVTLTEEENKTRQVFVASYGRYPVVVSSQNGPIKAGDYLCLSSLDGVAMKADEEQDLVIGKAATSFDGKTNVEGNASLTNADGKKVQVALGRVTTNIVMSHNPFQSKGDSLPGALQKVSKGIAAKPVSIGRIYLGLAILLVSAFVAGSLLYAGVRAGLVAIGRNPLAKRSIIRGMLQAAITSMIIFILGMFAVYLVLKL